MAGVGVWRATISNSRLVPYSRLVDPVAPQRDDDFHSMAKDRSAFAGDRR